MRKHMLVCVLMTIAICVFFLVDLPSARERGKSAAPTNLFTKGQVARGKEVYAQSCAACHGAALSGGSAPPLTGQGFQASWSHPHMTVEDLFFLVRTTMPPRASRSVSIEDHAAAVAYILHANGYTAGATTLAVDSKGLDQPFPWAGKFRTASAGGLGAEVATASLTAAAEFIAGAPDAKPGAAGPDQAALNNAETSTNWLLHTHDYAGTRFSPLDQINTDNAARLAPACVFQLGEADNFQTGPIVYNGTMYVTTWKSTFALDAATCKPKWRYRWEPRGDTVWERNRGVAIKDGYLVRGTPDGYLLALNAQSGELVWARHVAKTAAGETFSMAPMIYEDLVLIGPAGSENNIKGWVGAFRLADGAPVWRFNTVPQPGEPGFETWKSPLDIPMGGGAVWTFFALDTKTGELHVAATNPAPDLPVHLRQGDNLYTNAIIVLDVRTGKLRWYRQLVPNDSHDWDLSHVTPLFSTAINGNMQPLVATVGKDGILRTLDRKTHEIMYATPVTTLENTQQPITTTPTHACPGTLGGVEWNGPAYNPSTNLLYVPAVDWCMTFTAFEKPRYIPGKLYMGGSVDFDPREKSQGWLTAIDASTGAVKWKYRSPRPMVAAVTTTAGGLLLSGEMTGDFLTLDAQTGRELYRFNTGGSMGGGIVTYAVGGKQYIAAASGSPSNFWMDTYPGAPTIVVFTLR